MAVFNSDRDEYRAIYAEEAAMIDAAELLAEAMDRSGVGRQQLADELGVSHDEIVQRLRAGSDYTIRDMAKMLNIMGEGLELKLRVKNHPWWRR